MSLYIRLDKTCHQVQSDQHRSHTQPGDSLKSLALVSSLALVRSDKKLLSHKAVGVHIAVLTSKYDGIKDIVVILYEDIRVGAIDS